MVGASFLLELGWHCRPVRVVVGQKSEREREREREIERERGRGRGRERENITVGVVAT
jgi:hypothetical protein